MSSSLPTNLVKATTGQYSIPIRAIFAEAWQRIKGMKKAFWGGFALLFLTLLGVYVVFQFILAIFHVFHFADLSRVGQFIAGGFFEVLRLLLSISLVFLALQHLRNQTVNSTMVFEFRKNWQPLALLGTLFYLLNFLLVSGGRLILNHFYTNDLQTPFAIGTGIQFVVFVFLFTYIALIITMTMLLILDKKMALKESFNVAFKSVNQHGFKNIALLILASLLFFILGVVTLGIGLIWLLPFLSMISAIQYEQIFCEGRLEAK
jgi:hypothetical protein